MDVSLVALETAGWATATLAVVCRHQVFKARPIPVFPAGQ